MKTPRLIPHGEDVGGDTAQIERMICQYCEGERCHALCLPIMIEAHSWIVGHGWDWMPLLHIQEQGLKCFSSHWSCGNVIYCTYAQVLKFNFYLIAKLRLVWLPWLSEWKVWLKGALEWKIPTGNSGFLSSHFKWKAASEITEHPEAWAFGSWGLLVNKLTSLLETNTSP